MTALIAVFDIGKTNAKVVLVDPQTGQEVFGAKRTNVSIDSPLGHQLDVLAIERWLVETLRSAPRIAEVVAIVPIAHGAAAVLIDAAGEVIAAPDYEDPRFNCIDADYEPLRDAFSASFSPSLPLGLNLGRQLFHLQTRCCDMFRRVSRILLYPQYWAWRLSGVMASEVTSLGCHTDLWRPLDGGFSDLVRRRHWHHLFPALRPAGETLGTVSADIAASTGLNVGCRVICGIHDSNASYLQYLLGQGRERPFAAISSGTWTIVMANRGDLTRLKEERDMLANVDAFGSPVATARFMGGREYEAIAQTSAIPDIDALHSVVRKQAFALPSFADAGPFPLRRGELIDAQDLSPPERAALATLYMALMSDLTLDALGARGDVLIDGPLASNPLFAAVLAALRSHAAVFPHCGSSGVCVRAAAHLAGFETAPAPAAKAASPVALSDLDNYRNRWRNRLPQ